MNVKNEPLVFLIVLNYKGYEDTCECVDNLLQQNYGNYKILIVDNDSQDQSYEKLVMRYPYIQIIQTGKNLGYAGGNNIGIQIAVKEGAQYIGILNNDIKAEVDVVAEMVTAFAHDERLGMIGPAICEWNSDIIQSAGAKISFYTGNSILYHKGENYLELNRRNMIYGNYLGGAALFFRTSILDEIGQIPECYFLFFEETEWCAKTIKSGYFVACDLKVRIWHKESATVNKISNIKKYYLDRNRILFIKRNAKLHERICFECLLILQTVYRRLFKGKQSVNNLAIIHGIKGITGKWEAKIEDEIRCTISRM